VRPVGRTAIAAVAFAVLATVAAPPSWALDRPAPGDRLHIQFTGPISLVDGADVIEVDGEDTSPEQIAAWRGAGHVVACYTSAGSVEDWRPDAAALPAAAVGAPLDGWPGERWLDVRHPGVIAVIAARVTRLAAKGCQAIEFDNVDGYQNDTGFPLTRADQIRFDRALARLARQAGLSPGLKNAVDLIPSLVRSYDWALNEECVTYDECGAYRPFVRAGKAVFVLEYGEVPTRSVCRTTRRWGLAAQIAHLSLDGVSRHC